MNALEITHNPQKCRLFVDSSKLRLRAVLLLNGNHLPSIPEAHGVQTKEMYNNLKLQLNSIEYIKYSLHLCGDIKIVSLLTGFTRDTCVSYVSEITKQGNCFTPMDSQT